MAGDFLAVLVVAAVATLRQDAVPPLASALAKNDADPSAVKAALDGAIEAGAAKAVPPLLAAIDRLGEAVSKSEVDAARTGRELEGLQKKEGGGDAAAVEDKRASLAKSEQSTSSRRQVLD